MNLYSALPSLVLLAAAFAAPAPASTKTPPPPNVIIIITDDQGYGDLGATGNPVLRTPALDALHATSIRFTDFHVSPTCSPTRGALMSGQYANRAGPWHTIMGRSFLRTRATSLGELFRRGGYATGLFGKWHLGDNYPYRAQDRGFGETVVHGGGGIGQTPDHWDNSYFDDVYQHNGRPVRFDGYCTDVFFREARRFVASQAAARRPFFATIATNAPHSPFHCPDEFVRPYREAGLSPEEAQFFGMIANIDENVGALRAWLRAEGLAANTLFIFMTDNGTASGARVFDAGLRGQKGSEYDGGHRVPFWLHWPAAGWDRPRDVPALAAHVDVLPTLVELCGLPPTAPDYPLDGRSLLPLLRPSGAVAWPDRVIITDSQRVPVPVKWKNSAAMTQRWRLINGRELYDMSVDRGQSADVADRHPGVVARLRDAYEAWWSVLEPTFVEEERIVVGHPAENPSQLTAHDWLAGGATPWHQGMIRAGLRGSGHWAVRVASAGNYRISLRRWPAGLQQPLAAAVPPGAAVPGLKAFRQTPGQALDLRTAVLACGPQERRQVVSPGADQVSFTVDLPAGPLDLAGWFEIGDSSEKLGAYYAVVERL